ncbi:MAG: hypothetical protein ACM319_07085 [Deltaproteobacteria bacterium]|nr:hypothetical protein [Candidatus Deferrimicrobiaceae bacterium]
MKNRNRSFLSLLVLLAVAVSGCAAGQVTKSFNDRSEEIAAKIAEAERLGARRCSPRELARAKVELEHARHEVRETHYPPEWVHREFDKAERAANELLEQRRLAASLGVRFRCLESGG